MFASLLLMFSILFGMDGPSAIEGVVLRAHEIHDAERSPMTRILLSTTDGLCAVRIPGEAADWDSFADAEVEIRGVMRGDEFVVEDESDIRLLKYPSTNPESLVDILPAGEFVRRRAQRRNILIALGGVLLAALLVSVLARLVVRNRRKAYFMMGRVARERRRTGALHEDVEQQLEGVRMLLENAIAYAPDTPKEVREAVAAVTRILEETNRKVHRTAFAGAPVQENRRGE